MRRYGRVPHHISLMRWTTRAREAACGGDQTETLRAFTREEAEAIIRKL